MWQHVDIYNMTKCKQVLIRNNGMILIRYKTTVGSQRFMAIPVIAGKD